MLPTIAKIESASDTTTGHLMDVAFVIFRTTKPKVAPTSDAPKAPAIPDMFGIWSAVATTNINDQLASSATNQYLPPEPFTFSPNYKNLSWPTEHIERRSVKMAPAA